MIWPGRRLALALLVPMLLSLGLFVSEAVWTAVAVLDIVIATVALARSAR